MPDNTTETLELLSPVAWQARENALVIGNTRVGCAIFTSTGKIFSGCNVEHKFRCHDVHAEINAITTMIAAGETVAQIVLIVAERERFTPCGGCMDWIMQFGGKDSLVAFQNRVGGQFVVFRAAELMPHYPK